ncbi:MAG TPA: hypothetical protein VF736_02485 [Pyrinomonadaceae bacterium]
MALQVRVSKMLGYGFAFSVVWAGVVGSLLSLIIGLRARGLIRKSGGAVSGIWLAWWCIGAGAFGLVTVTPYVIWLMLTSKR